MVTVLLIDDHALVRSGIRNLLKDTSSIELIAEADRGQEGIRLVRELKPDVVLLDINLPDISGIEVAEKLLRFDAEIKILALTAMTNDLFPFRLLEVGVKGYLTKESSRDELIQAIKTVSVGRRYLSSKIASKLALLKVGEVEKSVFESLTNKEMEVLLMVVQGKTVKEISDNLFITPKTVHTYRRNLFDKLDVANDVELTLLAIRQGVVDIESV